MISCSNLLQLKTIVIMLICSELINIIKKGKFYFIWKYWMIECRGGGGNHDDPMFFLASKDNHCSWTASLVNMMWLFLYTGVILNVQIFASSSLHGFEAEIGRLNHISGWMTTIGNHTNEHEWIEVHSYQHVTVFILLHWSCNLTERKLT